MTETSTGLPASLAPPRFSTPRHPDRPTYGHEVAAIAQAMRTPLMPWQRHAVDVALEYDPQTGDLIYSEVVLTVPRQCGKSLLIFLLFVWRMTVVARRWESQTATYLAQTRTAARKKLERDFAKRLRSCPGFREIRNPRARPIKYNQWKLSLNNGAEHILFGGDNYLQIEAPSDTASHGDTLDMPVIDEAFSHRDDAVEQAVEPAMMTRRAPQLWVVSTAGNEKSVYLWRKVLAGREACRTGKHGAVCYLEWSAPEGIDFDEPGAFHTYHPAVGHTITEARLRALLDKARRNPDAVDEDGDDPGEDGFRRAYGNMWVRTPVLGEAARPTAIPGWDALMRDRADPESKLVGRLALGVGVSPDGASACIAVAGRRADGTPQVEIIERSDGAWWIEKRIADVVAKHGPAALGYDAGGPAAAMAPEIERGAGTCPVVKLNGRAYSAACEAFVTACKEDRVRHVGQTWLATSVGGAAKRVTGQGWVWDWRAATADLSPLVAATVALRVLETLPEEEPAESFFAY